MPCRYINLLIRQFGSEFTRRNYLHSWRLIIALKLIEQFIVFRKTALRPQINFMNGYPRLVKELQAPLQAVFSHFANCKSMRPGVIENAQVDFAN